MNISPQRRLYPVAAGLLLCAGVFGWEAASLHIQQRDFLQDQGDARTIRSLPLPAHRGLISDRNGEPLAVSTPVRSIAVNPRLLLGKDQAIIALAEALELQPGALQARIAANAERGFLYIKRHLPPPLAARVSALGIDGVSTVSEYRRFYPQGEVTAHLVGLSNIDEVGQEGMELAYDHWLRGVPGRRRVMIDGRGRLIEELGVLQPSQPGNNLELSIDLRIQNIAYRELKAEYLSRRAGSGSIVVLDVHSGEVLALANQPSYNPHRRADIKDFGVLRNRAITDVFEPGSTLKPFTIAAALESGLYGPDSVIETGPGRMLIGGHEVRDLRAHGSLSLAEVVTRSSNVGSSMIALRIGPQAIRDLLERAGLGRNAGSGFPGERSGVLPGPHRWSGIETATLSFGYGVSTTALQLAQAYGVLADRGRRKPLSLLRLAPSDVPEGEAVLAPAVAVEVMGMLEMAAEPGRGGSAAAAGVPMYRVAGKTGTAHIVGEGGYADDRYNSLFVGIVPARRPRIVVVVIINEPRGGEHFGGEVAAPVFARVARGAMRVLNVPPDTRHSRESGNPAKKSLNSPGLSN